MPGELCLRNVKAAQRARLQQAHRLHRNGSAILAVAIAIVSCSASAQQLGPAPDARERIVHYDPLARTDAPNYRVYVLDAKTLRVLHEEESDLNVSVTPEQLGSGKDEFIVSSLGGQYTGPQVRHYRVTTSNRFVRALLPADPPPFHPTSWEGVPPEWTRRLGEFTSGQLGPDGVTWFLTVHLRTQRTVTVRLNPDGSIIWSTPTDETPSTKATWLEVAPEYNRLFIGGNTHLAIYDAATLQQIGVTALPEYSQPFRGIAKHARGRWVLAGSSFVDLDTVERKASLPPNLLPVSTTLITNDALYWTSTEREDSNPIEQTVVHRFSLASRRETARRRFPTTELRVGRAAVTPSVTAIHQISAGRIVAFVGTQVLFEDHGHVWE